MTKVVNLEKITKGLGIAAAAGWNYQQNKQSVELSDLALENIEALADPEIEVVVLCSSYK